MSVLPKIDFPNVLRGSYDSTAGAIRFIDTSQLVPAAYDEIALTYDGSNNLTVVHYKNAGTTVSTLTLTYDGGGNLTDVLRS